MRLKIKATDRIGISQEILSELVKLNLNIRAMEVISRIIYLHLDIKGIKPEQLSSMLSKVEGVIDCRQIEFLPTESREQHLNALLRRLPDPMFDVNEIGNVISCNYQHHVYINKSIEKILGLPMTLLRKKHLFTLEVNFDEQIYHAEISPLWVEGNFNGAVILLKSLNKIGQQLSMLQSGADTNVGAEIIGKSVAIVNVKQQIAKFSVLDLPLLIAGETGTGKELVARAIHQQSARSNGPFLALNCASLPEHLLESELFGYVAGAFTGASEQGKPGLFELAGGGTVFLDEVAEMSVYLQAKLLRFLQDYSFRRLGGIKEQIANIRIISASHQPFEQLVKEGKFREDLFYRLNVLNLSLPPLRARISDITILSKHFIDTAAQQVNLSQPKLLPEAFEYLSVYQWPGNIRQLQNVMFRLVALNSGSNIGVDEIKRVLTNISSSNSETERIDHWLQFSSWKEAHEAFEQSLLTQFYPHYRSTRKLAQRLKVSHNKVAMKLRQHQIDCEYN